MVAFASRARVSLAIVAAAGATLAAALALPPAAKDARHTRVFVCAPPPPRLETATVLAIDRSNSMSGAWLEAAKQAAKQFVANLDDQERVAIVAFSERSETIVPMARASDRTRAAAMRAIDNISVENGTCISCGITQAAAELASAPQELGIRRIVIISDGHALVGIRDQDELVELAAEVAGRGATISTIALGGDHNAALMARMSAAGHGVYHSVINIDALARSVDDERRMLRTPIEISLPAEAP